MEQEYLPILAHLLKKRHRQKILISYLLLTNSAVGKLLAEAGIAYRVLEGTSADVFCGVHIEACDGRHEEIYEDIGQVQNTGYFVDGQLFYSGDAFTDPQRPVHVLALPLGGPWCTIADAMRYVLKVQPSHAFPVHDGIERTDRVGILRRLPNAILPEYGITFHDMKDGESFDV
jgi:hypothetical protein